MPFAKICLRVVWNPGARGLCHSPHSAKGASSHQWLSRQRRDPYVQGAKVLDYRARSAFKLLEMDDRVRVLRPGLNCLDAGCAPGSWSQVMVERVNARGTMDGQPIGTVIGIDKAMTITPLEGATLLGEADITASETAASVTKLLRGDHIDFLASDMAPEATGNRPLDQERMMMLLYSFLHFGLPLLRPGGVLLAKILDGPYMGELRKLLSGKFEGVKILKPPASREESSEAYILARHFKAPQ